MISFILLAAGCAMTSRPLVEAPAQKLPSQTKPVAESQNPAPQVEPKLSTSVNPSLVVCKRLSLNDNAETNDERLLNVCLGISRRVVEQIKDVNQAGKWTNPFKHQAVISARRKNI